MFFLSFLHQRIFHFEQFRMARSAQMTCVLLCLLGLTLAKDDAPGPRDHDHTPTTAEAAKIARLLVHHLSWGTLSHISGQDPIKGSPIGRVYAMSDGPTGTASGVPYFYVTATRDPEIIDLKADNKASLTLSMAQTPFCKAKYYDPTHPKCAQIILTGEFIFLDAGSPEFQKAQEAMFARHPTMRKFPESHNWVLAKLDIKRILLVAEVGGNQYPTVEDYFAAKIDESVPNMFLDVEMY